MKFKYKEETFELNFRYDIIEEKKERSQKNELIVKRRISKVTLCSIDRYKNNLLLSSFVGTAKCTYNDTFVKETGRKIALNRAVSFLEPELKDQILKIYGNRTKNK